MNLLDRCAARMKGGHCVQLVHFANAEDKIRYLRSLIAQGSMDPPVREGAANILRRANIEGRDYLGQITELLRWVQDNCMYLGEAAETFQSAGYTLEQRYGDCDDMVVLLGAMLESILIPVKLEVIGWPVDGVFDYRHIYLRAGLPPKAPTEWIALEATMKGTLPGFEPAEFAEKNFGKATRTF